VGVATQPLRIVLGLLALFFAYSLGRVGMRLYLANQPFVRALSWALRTTVCLAGVFWSRGFDLTSIVFLALAAAGAAAGAWLEFRPKHVEEIHILPPDL
jgi:hypothetical protein